MSLFQHCRQQGFECGRPHHARTVTRDHTLDQPTQDAETIRRVAGECLKRVPLDRRIRLLGVRASALTPEDEAATLLAITEGQPTGSLFD